MAHLLSVAVAGSTGATGRVLVPLARQLGFEVVPLVRSRSTERPEGAREVDFADRRSLVAGLQGAQVVLQLIGTMRKRFGTGDTYEASDIGTTVALVEAAKAQPTPPHFILLGSAGAGSPMGAYLKAKAKAEAVVRDSGLPWTTFRPSALEGGPHRAIPGLRGFTRLFGLRKYEPITLEQLSLAMLACAKARAPLGVALEGEPLWQLVAQGEALRR